MQEPFFKTMSRTRYIRVSMTIPEKVALDGSVSEFDNKEFPYPVVCSIQFNTLEADAFPTKIVKQQNTPIPKTPPKIGDPLGKIVRIPPPSQWDPSGKIRWDPIGMRVGSHSHPTGKIPRDPTLIPLGKFVGIPLGPIWNPARTYWWVNPKQYIVTLVQCHGQEDIKVMAREDIKVMANEDTNIMVKEDINVIAKEDINVMAKEDLNVMAKEVINVIAKGDINVIAKEIQVQIRCTLFIAYPLISWTSTSAEWKRISSTNSLLPSIKNQIQRNLPPGNDWSSFTPTFDNEPKPFSGDKKMSAQSFHFSQETPPDSMFSDIQTLNKFQDESSRLFGQLEDFAAENGVSGNALKNVFKSILSIPNSALKKSLSPEQIKEDLDNLVTAASSELDKVGNTFLQLKLVINTGNGVTNSYMELTLPQFYSFLHEMEKAKASLEYLS
ncbi:COMD7-like protein [Mya arenaria]|uniref:COMD7-like protein n=1 Tax=Mya arenaria TaxID=6604 RepID=A0ABY7FVV1_MYAAR|nr:COMD7-like protein [Mya arenaria]